MSSVDDETPGGSTGITIKYGKGYEDTWANFRGSLVQIRENLIVFFGLTADETAGLTLSEVVLQATNLAHAKGNLGAALGATPIATKAMASAPATGDVWAEAGGAATPAKKEGPSQSEILIETIGKTDGVDALKRLWAENQAAFADTSVMDAWQARGRAPVCAPVCVGPSHPGRMGHRD